MLAIFLAFVLLNSISTGQTIKLKNNFGDSLKITSIIKRLIGKDTISTQSLSNGETKIFEDVDRLIIEHEGQYERKFEIHANLIGKVKLEGDATQEVKIKEDSKHGLWEVNIKCLIHYKLHKLMGCYDNPDDYDDDDYRRKFRKYHKLLKH